MDASDYPSLGRLATLSAQLSAQNRRLASVIDAQLDEVERLFQAAAKRDWPALLQLSEQLAAQASDAKDKHLVRSAQKACEALRRNPSGRSAARRLSELLTACREAKLKRQPK